ncbi:MAG: CDP-glycerol glycerophosphotransferase family protein [Coriobacteriales bacterium]|jgi:CDP-glycerol glycerophosphotransferase (TagB/SpsB family)|nr:CDP-glycerol glycerophosphotransferase family protein [Coriobacteriales bacterium]
MRKNMKEAFEQILPATESDQYEAAVTVICVSYNHQDYIRDALEGFVAQQTNFPFCVYIGDDASTDSTPEILKEYAKRYPGVIIPVLREKNMGAQANLRDLCNRITTRYAALCDGDDYWCDPLKLQKQFDCLEEHPEVNACFCNAQILAPDDWYLNSYYKPDKNGKRYIPFSIPGFNSKKKYYTACEYISISPAHTSTMFFRWNHNVCLSATLDKLLFGDNYVMTTLIRDGLAAYLPDVVSVYRRSEVGTTMHDNLTNHHIDIQYRWFGVLRELKLFFETYYYDKKTIIAIENRMKLAVANYNAECLKVHDFDALRRLPEEYPDVYSIAMTAFVSFYRDSRRLTDALGWDNYQLFVRNPSYLKALKDAAMTIKKRRARKECWRSRIVRLRSIFSKITMNTKTFLRYWLYSFIPKKKNYWAITSFFHRGFLDNTMYFYKHVIENHPEINIVWLTTDDDVIKQLKKQEFPVLRMNSKEGRKFLSCASLVFTDHYRCSDYSHTAYNANTKVVQLWHGIGVKRNDLETMTKIQGVVRCDDIVCKKTDSLVIKTIKKLKRLFREPFRELFEEKYLLFVSSSAEDVRHDCASWRMPESIFFISGSPRTTLLHRVLNGYVTPEMEQIYDECPERKLRVLYAPTYRWDESSEFKLIHELCLALPELNEYLTSVDAELVIRLHPHTWRNFNNKIGLALQGFDNIRIDKEKDIYPYLGLYDILISDYSSIASDFLILERPEIFYWPDYDLWSQQENSTKYDPFEYCCGAQVTTWSDVIAAIEKYRQDPSLDAEWRRRIKNAYFDTGVNDENNSERIVQEVKRRIGLR